MGNLQDSGNRTDIANTGALRDMAEGKGRCDLLPASALLRMMVKSNLNSHADIWIVNMWFLSWLSGETDVDYLAKIADWCMHEMEQKATERVTIIYTHAILRLARHYENGAKKYADRNWEKGLPLSSFFDSGYRHFLKWVQGQTDEDHMAAVAWNMLGAMWTEEHKPELIDIPTRLGK